MAINKEQKKKNTGGVLGAVKNLTGFSSSIADKANSIAAPINNMLSKPSRSASALGTAPTFNYAKSDEATQADALLQQKLASNPGEWQDGTWTDQLNDTINQILNREKFSYDLNKDALYQQYADQYTTRGKLASMDVMGQAAAMTGGYGNSFAQTAGQQAYQGYLQQLNDVVPELYGMALDQHNQEVQNLYTQAGLMSQMDDQEYGRYQDKLSQYYTDLNYLTENARYMSETEYQKALNDFNIKYGQHRDAVADEQWKSEFDTKNSQNGSGGFGGSGGGGTGTPVAPVASDYADWDAGDWEGYFAKIRQSEGQAAAEEELHYFTQNGLIPRNMVTYGARGARGGNMGH